MRTIGMSILALAIAIYPVKLIAVPLPSEPKPAEPTAEQLAAAKEAYGNFGARYYESKESDPGAEQSFRFFHFAGETDDDTMRDSTSAA
jgi:hypothetical protein